jgi:catechol 2,3-dioxygenase-like lactoylglutathione lyase family enzyme
LGGIELDHCVIHVSDWEQSNAFYRDVLGVELIDRGGGTWAYRLGGHSLAGPDRPGRRPPGRPRVDIEEGPVARNGARPGGQSVYFRDPDGSLLELITADSKPSRPGGGEKADLRPYVSLIGHAPPGSATKPSPRDLSVEALAVECRPGRGLAASVPVPWSRSHIGLRRC